MAILGDLDGGILRGSDAENGSEDERLQRAIARTAAQNEAIYKSKGVIKVLTGEDVPKQEPIARDFRRKNQKYIRRVSEKEEGVGGKKFRRRRPVPAAQFRLKRETGLEDLDEEGGPEEGGSEGGGRKRRRKVVKVKMEEGTDEEWSPGSDEDELSDEAGKRFTHFGLSSGNGSVLTLLFTRLLACEH